MSDERFVGRVDEMTRAKAALDDVFAGDGRVLLFRGEAGIGKTRLADRTAILANEQGARVAWGRAWEEGGAPPYWPWIVLFRELGQPELFAARSDAATERFELFERVVLGLHEAAKERPLVIVLDDLHAADVPSLLLLQFVVRSLRGMRLLVVGTYREAEARALVDVANVMAKIAREGHALSLRRLSEAEVATWVRAAIADATDDTVRTVYAVTEGNPLFVEEVLRLGALSTVEVPEDVRAIVRQHLDRLPAEVRSIVAKGSMLGREIDASELTLLASDSERATVDEALAAAVKAGVLVGTGTRFAFTHGLLREELMVSLSARERAVLHWRIGDAYARDEEKLSEAAHHLLAGASVGDLDRAVQAVLRAAAHAMDIAAFEDAERLAQRGIDLLSGADEDVRLGELLVTVGEASSAAGAIERGRRASRRAAAIARKLDAGPLLVRAALAYAGEFTNDGTVDPVMVELLRAALKTLDASPSAARARVMARLALALLPAEDDAIDEVRSLAHDAIDMARKLDDPDTLMFVLSMAFVAVGSVTGRESGAMLDELFALATKRKRRFLELQLAPWRVLDLFQRGERERAERAIDSYARLVEDLGHPHYRWRIPMLRTVPHVLAGRFDEAEECAIEAVKASEDMAAGAALDLSCIRLTIAIVSGRFDGLVRHAAKMLEDFDSTPMGGPFATFVLAATGRREEARARSFTMLSRFGEMQPCIATIAETAILLEDVELARLVEARLSARRDMRGLMWGPLGGYVLGPVERVLGDLVLLLGRRDEAMRLYERAAAECRRVGADAHLAAVERRLVARGSGPKPTVRHAPDVVLEREGEGWRVASPSGITIHLKAQKGAAYLHYLLARPRQQVHVMELHAIDAGEDGVHDTGDAGAVLDPKAKASYAARIEDLREAVEEATRFGDRERAERARAELDAIAAELAQATGLGGRDRKAASQVERARINVQRCLKDTMKRIGLQDPALFRQLEATIKTGTYCSYDPL
jgi:hypothetical protein